ncbi:uncharacterized protein METZ01_LOCUS388412 [marine metagenome]|uniref:Uncharacterized protein n=1 Tax=marine metagenome TaxID=408172 RepID=A0A382UPD8_9ZZZZ
MSAEARNRGDERKVSVTNATVY